MSSNTSVGGGLVVLAAAIFWYSGCHSPWVIVMAVLGMLAAL